MYHSKWDADSWGGCVCIKGESTWELSTQFVCESKTVLTSLFENLSEGNYMTKYHCHIYTFECQLLTWNNLSVIVPQHLDISLTVRTRRNICYQVVAFPQVTDKETGTQRDQEVVRYGGSYFQFFTLRQPALVTSETKFCLDIVGITW